MTSSHAIVFDQSRHPLVVIRLGSTYTSAQFDQALAYLTEAVKKGPFGLVVDMRQAQMPNAAQRRSFIAMYERNDYLTRSNFLALGAVGDSILVGRVITALNWLRSAPHPVQTFRTLDAAEAWVLATLPEPLRQRVPPARARRES